MIKKIRKIITMIRHLHQWPDDLAKDVVANKERIDIIYDMLKIGIDVHYESDSWAVFCIEGKRDYVNFVRLKSSELRELARFIRQFDIKERSVRVDMPRLASRELFFRGYR
jgi:hypothetical protein